MMGNRDDPVTPPRLLRTHPLPAIPVSTEALDEDKPFKLVAVCLWSIVGVALTTLMVWLALAD
jgi:nitrate reductase NapE component